MKIAEPLPNIWHLNFAHQYPLAKTFVRFQEHYENTEFRGKIFTLDEFREWYMANPGNGQFDYYEYWTGFNVPSEILEPFYEGKFDPLSLKERVLLNMFKHKRKKPFYLIGTFGDDEESLATLKHELAHGLFFTTPEYKAAVLETLREIPETESNHIKLFLDTATYHPSVWNDETQAWIIDDLETFEKCGLDGAKLKGIERKLQGLFTRFSGGLLLDQKD